VRFKINYKAVRITLESLFTHNRNTSRSNSKCSHHQHYDGTSIINCKNTLEPPAFLYKIERTVAELHKGHDLHKDFKHYGMEQSSSLDFPATNQTTRHILQGDAHKILPENQTYFSNSRSHFMNNRI
jgi:hypothetical protein